MRVDWLIPCRYAEPQGDGTMSIIGAGVDQFWLDETKLPAQIGLFLALRIVGTEEDVGVPHVLTIGLRRPSGEREGLVQADFQLEGDRVAPGTAVGILVRIVVGLSISEFGLHELEVAIDGHDDPQRVQLQALDLRTRPEPRAVPHELGA